MGLFSKEKKLTLEDIIKGIEGLSPEEKEELMKKISTPGAEEVEATEEATEEVTEEVENTEEATEEVTEDAEEVEAEEENTVAADDETAETDVTEPAETEAPVEEGAVENNEALDESEQDNVSEMMRAFGDRLTALEKSFGEFAELKAAMDEYTNKQKEAFGYKSNTAAGSHKAYADMSAAELKAHILNK